MTWAVFTFSGSQITSFEVMGHTGSEDRGRDVLCAFISGAVETVLNTVTDSFGVCAKLIAEEKDARVACRLDDADDEQRRIFDRTANGLRLTLMQLAKRYPDGLSVADVQTRPESQ